MQRRRLCNSEGSQPRVIIRPRRVLMRTSMRLDKSNLHPCVQYFCLSAPLTDSLAGMLEDSFLANARIVPRCREIAMRILNLTNVPINVIDSFTMRGSRRVPLVVPGGPIHLCPCRRTPLAMPREGTRSRLFLVSPRASRPTPPRQPRVNPVEIKITPKNVQLSRQLCSRDALKT
jgi:hypothetical protein